MNQSERVKMKVVYLNKNTRKNMMKFKEMPSYHQKRKKIKYRNYLKMQDLNLKKASENVKKLNEN